GLLIDAETARRKYELVPAGTGSLHADDAYRLLAQIPRAVAARDEDYRRAVADKAAIEQSQRIHHHPSRLMRRERKRLLHDRTRILQCMVAHRNRHRGKLAT